MTATINHGTHSGYTQHQHQKVPACDPCKNARRDYDARHYGKRNLAAFDTEWLTEGACYQIDDPLTMFRRDGLVYCQFCPVTAQCAAYRVRLEAAAGVALPGVWGGTLWVAKSGTMRATKSKAGA